MLSPLRPVTFHALRKAFLSLLAAAVLAAVLDSGNSQAASAVHQPTALYGEKISFDIFRNGSRIGTHTVSFSESHGHLTVTASTRMRISFLFVPAYRFDYWSRETWIDGNLAEVFAETDDNGKRSRVEAIASGGKLEIKGPSGQLAVDGWIFPTNHWNVAQVASNTVLNSITGQVAHVSVRSVAAETVAVHKGNVFAERFEYTGDLRDTHIWYDGGGRWVKMSFKARDGSWIEYRCTSCTADHSGG